MKFPTLLLAAVVLLSTASLNNAQEVLDYKTAFKLAQKGDKPLLVLVTSERCPPCVRMKKNTFPQLLAKNALKDCYLANVDVDKQPKLASQLLPAPGYPQLLIFEKRNGKWWRRYERGFMSVAKVEAFVGESIILRTARNTAKNVVPSVQTK